MSTLNISLPDQLKTWVTQQVGAGRYSSASDYLRDLIREDIREEQQGVQWLANTLNPLLATPQQQFIPVSANDVKKRARQKIKD
jgi:antitoxin ParD1/3/4